LVHQARQISRGLIQREAANLFVDGVKGQEVHQVILKVEYTISKNIKFQVKIGAILPCLMVNVYTEIYASLILVHANPVKHTTETELCDISISG
jgi:hypothetical protein